MPRTNQPHDVFKYIDMKGGDHVQCWPWKGKLNKGDNRPYFTVAGKRRPSYAYILETYKGEAQKGRIIRHTCDNPICCNPHHLLWGTHQDNMDDMKERERHGLPRIVVRAIHKLLTEGISQSKIAELYGISREAVSAISTGRNHKITEEAETDEPGPSKESP